MYARRVVHDMTHFHRRSVAVAGHPAEPAPGAEQGRVACKVRVRAALAAGGQGYQDHIRLHRLELVETEPQTLHHARSNSAERLWCARLCAHPE